MARITENSGETPHHAIVILGVQSTSEGLEAETRSFETRYGQWRS